MFRHQAATKGWTIKPLNMEQYLMYILGPEAAALLTLQDMEISSAGESSHPLRLSSDSDSAIPVPSLERAWKVLEESTMWRKEQDRLDV